MKLLQLAVSVLLIAAFGAPAAMADVVDQTTYTINFTGTGTLPTAGSFTYDPDTASFTSFLVTWNGTTFDITSGANTPDVGAAIPACIGGATGALASFALLTGACSPAPPGFITRWDATTLLGDSDLGFTTFLPNFNDIIIVGDIVFNNPTTVIDGQGEWSVTPVAATATPTPEPSSLIPAAMFLSVLLARKRVARLKELTPPQSQ